MGQYSRQKGKSGEREFARLLKSYGFDAYRSQQYCGSATSADVTDNTPFHFEVKRTERLQLRAAMEQADEDAPDDRIPAVAHRQSRTDWLVTLKASDLLALLARVGV